MFYIFTNGHNGTRFLHNLFNSIGITTFHGNCFLKDSDLNEKIKKIFYKNDVVALHISGLDNQETINFFKKKNIKVFYLIRKPNDKLISKVSFLLKEEFKKKNIKLNYKKNIFNYNLKNCFFLFSFFLFLRTNFVSKKIFNVIYKKFFFKFENNKTYQNFFSKGCTFFSKMIVLNLIISSYFIARHEIIKCDLLISKNFKSKKQLLIFEDLKNNKIIFNLISNNLKMKIDYILFKKKFDYFSNLNSQKKRYSHQYFEKRIFDPFKTDFKKYLTKKKLYGFYKQFYKKF